MADLTHGTKWSDTISLGKESSIVNIPVGGTYSDKDIELTVTIPKSTAKSIVGTASIESYIADRGVTYFDGGVARSPAYGFEIDVIVEEDGYISQGSKLAFRPNITAITLSERQSFEINTTVGDFTWSTDSSGNVWIE